VDGGGWRPFRGCMRWYSGDTDQDPPFFEPSSNVLVPARNVYSETVSKGHARVLYLSNQYYTIDDFQLLDIYLSCDAYSPSLRRS
jgi:hypothetical protein